MKGQEFSWFIGEVRDIDDPEGLNRVKVLPFSYYNEDVSNDYLPWASVMMPNTLAQYKGIGGNHQLIPAVPEDKEKGIKGTPGSFVIGFFRDAPACQDPIILGSLGTKTQKTPDIPSGADRDNKIYTTKGGLTLHIIDTDEKESLEIKHPSGSYIKMHSDGDIEVRSAPSKKVGLNPGSSF